MQNNGTRVEHIAVIGAGQMGSGIAQVAAFYGYKVFLMDVQEAQVQRAVAGIASSLDRLIKKGTIQEAQKTQTLSRITGTSTISQLADCDVVIEAATENFDLKKKIFQDVDRIAKPSAILCTNTSSISVTKIAAQTKRPQQVAGMHFMNPVPLMKLVEGIRGLQTSDQTFATVKGLAERMEKVFIEAQKDMPGFIVNRILMTMINEAVGVLNEGLADPKSIDEAMKLGCNHPMGPLQLADFIGLDTCLSIMQVLYEGFADSKYRPNPLLVKYVEAGWMGKKSGRGFYQYDEQKKP